PPGQFYDRPRVCEPVRERQYPLGDGPGNVRNRTLAGEERRQVDRLDVAVVFGPLELFKELQEGIVQVAVLGHAGEHPLDDCPGAPAAVEAEAQREVAAEPLVRPGEVEVATLVAQVGVDVAEVLGPIDHHEANLSAGPNG